LLQCTGRGAIGSRQGTPNHPACRILASAQYRLIAAILLGVIIVTSGAVRLNRVERRPRGAEPEREVAPVIELVSA
jgi:hypothetical protein